MKSPNDDPTQDLKQELDNGFAGDERELLADLKDAAESAWEDDEFLMQNGKRLIESKIKTFVEAVRASCNDMILLAERSLERIRKAVEAEDDHLSDLIEKRHDVFNQELEPSPPRLTLILYPIFYLIIVLFSGCMVYDSVRLVITGLSKWSAVMPALLAPAPSTLLTYLCCKKRQRETREGAEKREALVRKVYWVSFFAAITMCVFFALSKLFASWLLTQSVSFSSQNMFSASPKTNYIERFQQFTAFIAFVASFASEVGFSSSLMVNFYKYFTRHTPIPRLDQGIEQSRRRIEEMEAQEAETIKNIGRRRILSNTMLDLWASEKAEQIRFKFKLIISKIKSREFEKIRNASVFRMRHFNQRRQPASSQPGAGSG